MKTRIECLADHLAELGTPREQADKLIDAAMDEARASILATYRKPEKPIPSDHSQRLRPEHKNIDLWILNYERALNKYPQVRVKKSIGGKVKTNPDWYKRESDS